MSAAIRFFVGARLVEDDQPGRVACQEPAQIRVEFCLDHHHVDVVIVEGAAWYPVMPALVIRKCNQYTGSEQVSVAVSNDRRLGRQPPEEVVTGKSLEKSRAELALGVVFRQTVG